ncbi:MAG: hypothetical protein KIT73_18330 [Burkholderiales bacterium]|nr:hypothetical protein [Burkholderiales bacterium]
MGAITWCSLVALCGIARAEPADDLCSVLKDAELADAGIELRSDPEPDSLSLGPDGDVPVAVTVDTCNFLGMTDRSRLTVARVSWKGRLTEPQLQQWLASGQDSEAGAEPPRESAVGAAKCQTGVVPAREVKAVENVVVKIPALHHAGCRQFLGDRQFSIEIANIDRDRVPDPKRLAALLKIVVERSR